MGGDRLLQTFLQDGQTFIERLNALFLKLEHDPDNRALLDQAFRWAHSLKSESSYMDYEGLTRIAHTLETELESLRKGDKAGDPAVWDAFFSLLDDAQIQMDKLRGSLGITSSLLGEVPDQEHSPEDSDQAEPPLDQSSSSRDGAIGIGETETEICDDADSQWALTDFENILLEEARGRGELFYRLVCELEEDTALKFAKIYLIINNLELIVNVVKTVPPLDELKRGEVNSFSILLTSSVGEGELYQAVNVDQVKQVHLCLLRYNMIQNLTETEVADITSPRIERPPGPLKVAPAKVEEVMGYLDEMRFRFHRLGEKVAQEKSRGHEFADWGHLKELMGGMEDVLQEIRLVPLEDVYKGFPRLVRDLSRRVGKEAELHITGGEIRADRRIAELLVEPLSHLIRNAIDHGIETPEERKRAGKTQQGLLSLRFTRQGDELIVVFCDDGRGLSRKDILAEAENQGVLGGDDRDLLHYLVQPGFSTVSTPNELSGRGLGLDVIARTVRQDAGGELFLSSEEGEGCEFTLRIPLEYRPLVVLLCKSGSEILAVPKRSIRQIEDVDSSLWSQQESGGLLKGGLPVFTSQGRYLPGSHLPDAGVVLTLSHLGHEAALIVDDTLFEQDIPEEQFRLGREIRPYVHEVFLGSERKDYFYIDPSFQV